MCERKSAKIRSIKIFFYDKKYIAAISVQRVLILLHILKTDFSRIIKGYW